MTLDYLYNKRRKVFSLKNVKKKYITERLLEEGFMIKDDFTYCFNRIGIDCSVYFGLSNMELTVYYKDKYAVQRPLCYRAVVRYHVNPIKTIIKITKKAIKKAGIL